MSEPTANSGWGQGQPPGTPQGPWQGAPGQQAPGQAAPGQAFPGQQAPGQAPHQAAPGHQAPWGAPPAQGAPPGGQPGAPAWGAPPQQPQAPAWGQPQQPGYQQPGHQAPGQHLGGQPQGWGQPGPAGGHPGAPSSAPALGLDGRQWTTALILGGVAYAAAFVGALLVALMQLAGGLKVTFGTFLLSLFGRVSSAFGGTVRTTVKQEFGDTSFEMTAATTSFGLFVIAVSLIALWLVGRRIGRATPAPKGLPRLLLAVTSGAVFTVLTVVLGAAISYGGDGGTYRVFGVGGLFVCLIVVSFVSYLALTPRGDGLLPSSFRRAGSQFLEHVVLAGGLLSLVVFLYMGFSAPEGGRRALWTSFLEAIPGGSSHGYAWDMVNSFALMHFGTLAMSGSSTDGGGSSTAMATMFSKDTIGDQVWIWIVALILMLVFLLLAGLRWRLRQGSESSSAWQSWLRLPAVYLVGGLVLMVASINSMKQTMPDIGGNAGSSVSYGSLLMIAGWVFLIIGVVGLVVEAISRFAADPILRALPAGLLGTVAWKTGADVAATGQRLAASKPVRQAPPAPPAGPQGWGQQPQADQAWGAPQQGQQPPASQGWGVQQPGQHPQQGQQPQAAPGWGAPQQGQQGQQPQPGQQPQAAPGWGAPQQGQQPPAAPGWGAPQQGQQPQPGQQGDQVPPQQGWGVQHDGQQPPWGQQG